MPALSFGTIFISLLGGILPAIIWLKFWLHEDIHPEPRRIIIYCFLGGMLAVPLVVPVQAFIQDRVSDPTMLTILWSFAEEFLKFSAALFMGILRKTDDEPVDSMIYLLTCALGFAAFENVLYLLTPLSSGMFTASLITGNLRFIGATLLHVIASTSIGIFIGLAFYKSKVARITAALFGLGIATTLHSAFNLFIMGGNGKHVFAVFFAVWVGIILLAYFFERVKEVRAY